MCTYGLLMNGRNVPLDTYNNDCIVSVGVRPMCASRAPYRLGRLGPSCAAMRSRCSRRTDMTCRGSWWTCAVGCESFSRSRPQPTRCSWPSASSGDEDSSRPCNTQSRAGFFLGSVCAAAGWCLLVWVALLAGLLHVCLVACLPACRIHVFPWCWRP